MNSAEIAVHSSIMANEDAENGIRVADVRTTTVWTPTLFAAVAIVCLLSVVIGCNFGYYSPAAVNIDQNRNPFHLTTGWHSWIVSGNCLGGLVGSVIGGLLVDRYGRKFLMMMAIPPYAIAWVVIPATKSAAILFLLRTFNGIFWTVLINGTIVYLTEISPSAVRGTILASYSTSLVVGILLMYFCGIWLPWNWLAIVPGAILAIVMPFLALLPESPNWLIIQGHKEAATVALAWFRGHEDVDGELEKIRQKAVAASENQVRWRELADKSFYVPVLIGCIVYAVQVFSGVDYVLFFTVTIFVRTNNHLDPYVQTALIGLANLGGSLMAIWSLDRMGRRPSLLSSMVASAFFISALGAYYKVLAVDAHFAESYLYWLPLTCLVLFQVSYSIGLGSVPAALASEMLPLRFRGLGAGIDMVVAMLCMFLETRFSLPLTKTWIHDYGVFWSFAVILLLGAIFVFLFVPETKGKTLDSIQEMFE